MINLNNKMLVGWVLAIAAINTGLSAFGFNVVEMLGEGVAKIVYILIGAVGVYKVYMLTMVKK